MAGEREWDSFGWLRLQQRKAKEQHNRVNFAILYDISNDGKSSIFQLPLPYRLLVRSLFFTPYRSHSFDHLQSSGEFRNCINKSVYSWPSVSVRGGQKSSNMQISSFYRSVHRLEALTLWGMIKGGNEANCPTLVLTSI